ncbi:MAG: DUF2085 domain-containing protein [Deltaproteobacteria bacterium]
MGSLVCHQIKERTLLIDNIYLMVCARDTGIYIGIIFGIAFLALNRRLNADWPPKLKHALILILMMVPMIIDGATSYMGVRNTDNLTRLITGGFFGFPLAVFFVVARNYNPNKSNKIAPFKTSGELGAETFIFIIFISLVYNGIIPWAVVSSLLVMGIITMFYLIVDSIVSLIGISSENKRRAISLIGVCCIFVALYVLKRYVFGGLYI